MNTELKLQYQLSNGNWINTNERTDEFLTYCEQNNGVDANGKVVPIHSAVRALTRDEVVSALLSGRELNNGGADWYSSCRSEIPVIEKRKMRDAAQARVEYVKCDCGHSIPRSSVMSASLGTSCPDCYDLLSN